MTRCVLTILLSVFIAFPSVAQDLKGRAHVVDGDTLWLGNIKVRLNGLDAPERGQPRYRAATKELERLVAGQIVLCKLNGEKSYDRYIGSCFVGDTDLAAAVIASGNALDCPRYSGGRYRKYETSDATRFIRQASYC
ncbi:thermonuclease family protein [Maritimibacter sp. 55A14]|uniref:thermonuclease family protein n=1 Tax=Maritimibacter sp. 55A14 TaxID=2174844 RepID=UPI001304FCB1|nr:thermonuclease family protein [Maritimibacter sp. 55A14]